MLLLFTCLLQQTFRNRIWKNFCVSYSESKHAYVHCVFQFSYLGWSNINLRYFQLNAFTPANIKEDFPLNRRALTCRITETTPIWPPWPDIQPLEQLPRQFQGSCRAQELNWIYLNWRFMPQWKWTCNVHWTEEMRNWISEKNISHIVQW